jgi:phospholipase/carboxylesterase
MSEPGDAILDAVTELLPPLLGTLEKLRAIARRMHPSHLPVLVEGIGDLDTELRAALSRFQATDRPDHLAGFCELIEESADLTLQACSGLREAAASADSRFGAYRAMRYHMRAVEALYPISSALPTVSRWFLNPQQRDNATLLAQLRDPTDDSGIHHAANERGTRGGFSVYVPEYYDPANRYPLVMALHGGAGHGRQFLWNWIREARGRGLILVTPTATGDTWSLMDPDIDTAHIENVLSQVRSRWNIDADRMLLTGMSDGGTFTLLSGLSDTSPFTHLAPVAASFHPLLLTMTDPMRIRGLPVYLVHGALDWMFPIQVARTATQALTTAGARVTYREIADLSHTYPTDENDRMVDWLLGRS